MIDNPHLDAPSLSVCPIPPIVVAACAFFAGAIVLASPASAAPAPKVQVCHIPPGNPDNFHTITISENALEAHLAHGDMEGSCNDMCDILCSDNDRCTVDYEGKCEETGCFPLEGRPPVNCDDGDVCTEDVICDPVEGCANAPQPGNICDDGDACSDGDVCDDLGKCGGTPRLNCCITVDDCDDGNLCTNDFCDGVPQNPSGTCSHADIECDDPDACTSLNCNPADGTCTIETPIVCDDGSGCTDDWCDPSMGCRAEPIACQPSDACTTSSCVEPGMCMDLPLNCTDDGIACTVESCDPVNGCESTANDSACDDGKRCTNDKCDPSSPFADGCRHDPIPDCCNSDADCRSGEVCNESTPIPRCEPAQPTCFTASDCIGSDWGTCRQQCLAVAGCQPGVCDNFDPNLHPEFAGTVDQCINQGIETACDDIDAYGRDFCGNVCPLETSASACPCWDGSATSVNGVSNVVELWELYGPADCSSYDFCVDVTNQFVVGDGSQASCISGAGAELTTTAYTDASNTDNWPEGQAQCWVQIDGQIVKEETFPIDSSEAEACIAEHDALITLGGTFPNYLTYTCGLGSF